jgi:hypothetical protein
MNGHNLDQQMAALQNLERQGQEENAMMRQLAEKSSHDSTSVRILTIITLIYLPCTVVSVSKKHSLERSFCQIFANVFEELLLYPVCRQERAAFR